MGRTFSLKEPISASAEYKRATRHAQYGKVLLSARPASSFSFKSTAIWPHNKNYENAVLRAIRDVFSTSEARNFVAAEFVLQAIEWHEFGSCEFGYYQAAKQATEEILRRSGVAFFN